MRGVGEINDAGIGIRNGELAAYEPRIAVSARSHLATMCVVRATRGHGAFGQSARAGGGEAKSWRWFVGTFLCRTLVFGHRVVQGVILPERSVRARGEGTVVLSTSAEKVILSRLHADIHTRMHIDHGDMHVLYSHVHATHGHKVHVHAYTYI